MVCITADPHHPTDAYATCGHHHHGGRLYSHFGRPYHHPTALKEADCQHTHHGCETVGTPSHAPHHPKVYRFVGQGGHLAVVMGTIVDDTIYAIRFDHNSAFHFFDSGRYLQAQLLLHVLRLLEW